MLTPPPPALDGLLADPDSPIVAAFVRQEVLLGTIRTIPTRIGRLLILPSRDWSPPAPARPSDQVLPKLA